MQRTDEELETRIDGVASDKSQLRDRLARQGFIPILVNDDLDSHLLVEGAVEAGCTVIECSCRRKDARNIIPWIKREFPHVSVLGATLIDGDRISSFLCNTRPHFISVEEMVNLGADGLVSFLQFRRETYFKYGERLIMIPGVGGYNEAIEQLEMGADLVKLQGATAWDVTHLAVAATLTHGAFPILISSNVSLETIPGFVRSGAALIGTGFNIILKDEIGLGKPITISVITTAVTRMHSAVRQARSIYQKEFYDAVEVGEENPLSRGGWIT